MTERLFTPRFLAMFLYSCLVFVSLFQLLPVAPYRMMALSGPSGDTGLFLGLLTFSSALSAPVTGPLSDRIGHRRTLIAAAACLSLITASYAVITAKGLLLATVAGGGCGAGTPLSRVQSGQA